MTETRSRLDAGAWPWVGLFVVIHGALGFYGISRQSLWLDEAMSLRIAQGSQEVMFAWFRMLPEQHPLYYYVLKGWLLLFGDSEAALRSLSVLFGAASIPLLFQLGRRVAGARIGLIASGLLAVSPFWIYYSQEGRMYTMMVFLVILSWLLWISAQAKPGSHRARVGYWLVSIAGVYTQFFFVFVVIAQFLADVVTSPERRVELKRWFLLYGVVAAVYVPWAALIFLNFPEGQTWKGWQHIAFGVPYTLLRFAVGYGEFLANHGWQQRVLEVARQDWAPLLVAAVAHGGLFGAGLLRLRSKGEPEGVKSRVVAMGLAAPVLVPLLLSPVMILSGERYFMVAFPFYLIVISLGALHLLSRPGAARGAGYLLIGLFVGVTAKAVAAQYFDADFGKEQWREVAEMIGQTSSSEATVLLSPPYTRGVLTYYLDRQEEADGVEVIALEEWDGTLESGVESFWVVVTYADGPSDVLSRLDEEGFSIKRREFFPKESGIWVIEAEPDDTRS